MQLISVISKTGKTPQGVPVHVTLVGLMHERGKRYELLARSADGRWSSHGCWHPTQALAEMRCMLSRDRQDNASPVNPIFDPKRHFN